MAHRPSLADNDRAEESALMAAAATSQGYDVGVEYSQTGPTIPYQAAVARISR